jgi:putative ABC transport system permease protein
MNDPVTPPPEGFASVLRAELKESFRMAMDALVAHKLRSALTLLGVLIGVFSIIVAMTTMRAMQSNIQSNLDSLGGQTFTISKWPAVFFEGPEGIMRILRRKNITVAQGMELQKRATLARSVGMETDFESGQMFSRFGKGSPTASLTGETPGSFSALNYNLQEGRILQETDVENSHDVCVLGSTLAKDLFPSASPLLERIKFNGINYTVVGVLEPRGAMEGGNQDNFALIPITTGLDRYSNRRQDVRLLVQSRDLDSYDDTLEQVRGILRQIRKVPPGVEDDFDIASADSVMAQINAFTLAVRIGVTVVSSIALLAAGIGIMNIMLVSVTERTREIGIRRAVGAKKRNIMAQFIMEAVVLCEVGGAMGVVAGIIGGNVVGHMMDLPSVIPIDWTLIGLGICSFVGIVFGTYPAYKASNLDPIESLRYE